MKYTTRSISKKLALSNRYLHCPKVFSPPKPLVIRIGGRHEVVDMILYGVRDPLLVLASGIVKKEGAPGVEASPDRKKGARDCPFTLHDHAIVSERRPVLLENREGL